MAQITISIPDEIAERLKPIEGKIPEILTKLVQFRQSDTVNLPSNLPIVYTEILDFLLKSPSIEDILDYKVSQDCQKLLEFLLTKNKEQNLTPEETAELDIFEQLEHLMILLKARAYQGRN